MKTLIATLAAVGALTAVAAPAAAQPYGYDRSDRYERYDRPDRGAYRINDRQARIERQIERGVRRGLLTRREVHELRRDLNSVHRLESAYRRDGRLSGRERAELDRRLDWSERRLAGRLGNHAYAYR